MFVNTKDTDCEGVIAEDEETLVVEEELCVPVDGHVGEAVGDWVTLSVVERVPVGDWLDDGN